MKRSFDLKFARAVNRLRIEATLPIYVHLIRHHDLSVISPLPVRMALSHGETIWSVTPEKVSIWTVKERNCEVIFSWIHKGVKHQMEEKCRFLQIDPFSGRSVRWSRGQLCRKHSRPQTSTAANIPRSHPIKCMQCIRPSGQWYHLVAVGYIHSSAFIAIDTHPVDRVGDRCR